MCIHSGYLYIQGYLQLKTASCTSLHNSRHIFPCRQEKRVILLILTENKLKKSIGPQSILYLPSVLTAQSSSAENLTFQWNKTCRECSHEQIHPNLNRKTTSLFYKLTTRRTWFLRERNFHGTVSSSITARKPELT